MNFEDESGALYQLTETLEAPAKKTIVWPWIGVSLVASASLIWAIRSIRETNSFQKNPTQNSFSEHPLSRQSLNRYQENPSRKMYEVFVVNEEDDSSYELPLDINVALDLAEDLFRRNGIRMGSIEKIRAIAFYKNKVIGAASLGQHYDSTYECRSYTFSVVVDDQWRRRGIAKNLIKTVMKEASEDPDPHLFGVWVVNPHMIPLLESLGFEGDGEWSQNNPHMHKYQS